MPSIAMILPERQTTSTPAEPLDMSTNAPSILAINGFFTWFAVLIVLARIYVRAFMLKTFGPDDYLIVAAMTCGVGVFICFIGETHHGVGMHMASITPDMMVKMLHWQFFHSLIVTIGISLVKLSVAFFLLRLVPGKKYKMFLYGMITFLTAFTISCAGTLIWSCTPIRASWDRMSEPNAKCFTNHTFASIGLFNSSINIITDVLFATLPIPVVWNLQVNIRTKITLIGILSLGYFACAASIYKTVLQTKVFENPDSTRDDSYFVWNSIELYIGILAASLPSLRPLFRSFLETTRNLRTRVTGGSSGPVGTGRHRYYMHEDGIGMDSLPDGQKARKYNVQVTTASRPSQLGSGKSGSDIYSKNGHTDDSGSEEVILPMQGNHSVGITRTVNVTVD